MVGVLKDLWSYYGEWVFPNGSLIGTLKQNDDAAPGFFFNSAICVFSVLLGILREHLVTKEHWHVSL